MDRRRYIQAFGVGGALSVAGCLGNSTPAADAAVQGEALTLATATTAYDSGLVDELVPGFERLFGAGVDPVVRGTGSALRTARNGDCDAVLVHARSLEDDHLRSGHGVNRRTVAVNDFLVVGPPEDPAGAAGRDPVAAFRVIADAETPFVSRGDDSGTHVRERRIWEAAGVDPGGDWYSETGQGMGNTLVVAEQSDAYALTDRGTFLAVAGDGLAAHVDHGVTDPPASLRNEYALVPTNPEKHDVAYPLAMAFAGYVTGPGQSRIADFRLDGERAFRPAAGAAFGQYVPSDWDG